MSLYQIIVELDSPENVLTVSPATLENLIVSVVDLLVEQQIETKIWVKPATTWVSEIERIHKQGKISEIYWCQTFAGGEPNWTKSTQYPFFSLKLASSSVLEREFFLAVISESFSLLILAQQQPISTIANKLNRRNGLLQLKVFVTVEASAIKKVLQGIRQKTENDVPDFSGSFPVNNSSNSFLLLQLLIKQIAETDNLDLDSSISSPSKRQGNLFSQSLLFQEEFVTQLSRELRPPLTNMKTAIRLLESKYLKVSQRERYLQLLHREWERQNSLLTGLLELVRLDHLSAQEQSESADIKEILPGIISTYQPIAKEQNIQLGYKISPNLPLVSCSSLWVKQIILNLLNNNLKFTPSGGRVFVEAFPTQTGVEICFSDTGIGINTNELPKIFESFYRGNNIAGEENKGAGLGLTIVKQLLDRCDGSITVSSQVNKGSVFRVSFKKAEE